MDEVTAYDAVILGGSGDFSVVERDQPFFQPMTEMLRGLVDTSFPTFGCCFGFQLLVDAMGGIVVRDPQNSELGSHRRRADRGGRSAIHCSVSLPRDVHRPDGPLRSRHGSCRRGSRILLSSQRCGFQALRVPGAPIWATQFHPELDEQGNRDRCVAYIKEFGQIEGYEALPSPDALTILPRFFELAVKS